jgi:hypothetical protein
MRFTRNQSPDPDDEERLERVEDTDDAAWFKPARRQPLHYRPLEDFPSHLNTAASTAEN